jgi:hypothetical protein
MTETEKQYARTFASESGKQVLSHLRSLTVERILGQNITNEELRWWAAQCAMVHQIENFIKRGNNPT